MKKVIKKEKLDIRITLNEKRKLLRFAKRLNLTLSSYVRMKLFSPDSKMKNEELRLKMGYISIEAQEMLNYLQEKYKGDEELERMVRNLWKHI